MRSAIVFLTRNDSAIHLPEHIIRHVESLGQGTASLDHRPEVKVKLRPGQNRQFGRESSLAVRQSDRFHPSQSGRRRQTALKGASMIGVELRSSQ
jgi:hypothetical protein